MPYSTGNRRLLATSAASTAASSLTNGFTTPSAALALLAAATASNYTAQNVAFSSLLVGVGANAPAERRRGCSIAFLANANNATFTAKPKSIKWKAAPAFAMDFRAGNYEA